MHLTIANNIDRTAKKKQAFEFPMISGNFARSSAVMPRARTPK